MYRDFINEYAGIRQREMRRSIEGARKAGRRRERLRSQVARRLVDVAFAVETEASWRAMWERMAAPSETSGSKPPRAGKRRYAG